MGGGGDVALSIVAEGSTRGSRFAGLESNGRTTVIEVSDGATIDVARLNPVVDEAPSPWILLVRAGESIGSTLASEIAASLAGEPRAWGFRIGRRRIYCGQPLLPGRGGPGEVRLFHRRRARLQPDGRMKVQGTVVRLTSTLDLVVYESEARHIDALQHSGRTERGIVRRLTRFVAAVIRHGPRSLGLPSRRYLWIEAGWSD